MRVIYESSHLIIELTLVILRVLHRTDDELEVICEVVCLCRPRHSLILEDGHIYFWDPGAILPYELVEQLLKLTNTS